MVDKKFKKICVVGLGYIGLPTAAILASRGVEVIGVDINQQAVDTINAGEIHIVEPDLDIIVRSVVQTKQLRATTIPEEADAFLLAVPTPFNGNKEPDLSYIMSATRAIAPVLEKGNLVVLESTSPVGTTEKIGQLLSETRPDLHFPQNNGKKVDVNIAHCPERVLPGYVLQELVSNDRIIGGLTPECSAAATALYKIFVKADCVTTNARTAELVKLTENSNRDVNIAFANEISLICDKLDVNVWELIELANRHPRINILQPGPGVGGHCIAVDPWFIVSAAPDQAKLIRTAREVNDFKPHWVIEKVRTKAERFKNPVIGCLGLTFKANIDDLRESPALDIVVNLNLMNIGEILVCEPNANGHAIDFELYDLYHVIKEADILVVLVDHDEFIGVDQDTLKEKVVIDTRGIWR